MRLIPDCSLWLGHARDARDQRELMRMEIAAVIDLAIEEPPAALGREMIYGRFPLLDGADNPPYLICAAIDLLTTLLREKVPTLVACSGGLSRTPAIAAAAIHRLGHMSIPDAVRYLARFGPCDVSPALLQDVMSSAVK